MNLDIGPNHEDGDTLVPEVIEATLVYEAYQASVEAGQPPDPDRLIADHPALADLLRTLITTDQQMARLAGEPIPVFEDYRIIRMLGRGGMGVVYEADRISRCQHVAIKVLTAATAMDPQRRKRFLEVEIPAARLLRHAHIVPIIDHGCEHGVYYYAMPFIAGQDLAQLIKAIPRADSVETIAGNAVSGSGCARSNGDASKPLSESLRSSARTNTRDWFETVARWGLKAAKALEYAHEQGVVHRDIKPSNLLLDGQSNVWITDFGLAHIEGEPHLTATRDLPGTPRYMSPEQVQARRAGVDHRTDIYSLGATLYELLTQRPAFEGDDPQDVMRRVMEEEPKAPRRVNPAIPRDLETIVLKAMAKERDYRYTTAQEMADDLRRLLDRKPIQARRLSPLDRASRWARRRRKAAVTAVALLITAVVGLSVGVFLIAQAKRRAIAAGVQAEARARESRYESLMQQILRLRLAPHIIGWSADAWSLVREVARLQPGDAGSFQAQVAATLIGIDARLVKRMATPTSSLSFDPDGRRLWIGGGGEKLRTWDRTTDRGEMQGPPMDGPFAFRADGALLQLGVTRDAKTGLFSLQLWDAAKQTATVFQLPDNQERLQAYALSPEGTYVGAVVVSAQGQRTLRVWETSSGRVMPKMAFQAVDLAFSPDASLLIAWDEAGQIRLWSMPESAPLGTVRSGATPIRSIAFGRAPDRSASTAAAAHWFMACGDAGGTVTVWDLEKRIPTTYCRGSHYDVYAVAFSPDGTTLASAGRDRAKIWDVATGRLLLELNPRNVMTSVAFSPDGTRLAVGSQAAFGNPGGVDVYELEEGRGIRTLRGLRGLVEKTIFSPDGQLIAGLSQDFRVAIFDQSSGRVRVVLDAPRGLVADNSSLAFSPDGRRFAFSAGHQAKLWDTETGRELGAWTLPEGLADTLAFRGPDQLLLLRMETRDGETPPNSSTSWVDHPRVLRLRNLLGDRPTEPLRTITDFNRHVHQSQAAPDGKYFVVGGIGGPKGDTRSVNVYDTITGEKLWTFPARARLGVGMSFHFDPTGKILSLDDDGRTILVEMPTRAVLGHLDKNPNCLGPGARLWLGLARAGSADQSLIHSIYDRERTSPLLHIATDSEVVSLVSQFSPDGRQVVWGNTDGSVSLCDLKEVQEHLARVGLGW